ncbi:MAG: hypothetical protein AMJ91_06230 [candidate division Zixibacteria bacterium SM23_73_3]|nr:MAG: hypothetical protein AMJ91_06230 [candidate division Zixibacteria bacterium SM23_73_3]
MEGVILRKNFFRSKPVGAASGKCLWMKFRQHQEIKERGKRAINPNHISNKKEVGNNSSDLFFTGNSN